MYRKVVITATVYISGPIQILYHVSGSSLLYQQKVVKGAHEVSSGASDMTGPVVFDDSIRLSTKSTVDNSRLYEFILDVAENQRAEEAIEEITSTGVVISVYNEHGVVVCRNVPKTVNSAPGEMTSESINGTGEMTSEPIDGTGEMTSEPIDGPGATI